MLIFDETKYTDLQMEIGGVSVAFRAFEKIPYCERPADPDFQTLSIFVPACYYRGETLHGYDLHSAPIFFPNTIGGYMPGPAERPGRNPINHDVSASFYALAHGYVVVSAGARGNGMVNAEGDFIGTAPSNITDLKAAVRFLKANRDRIPGDVDHIISNGTSAGGAVSALLGATGNHPDYEPYLRQIGALEGDDSIFASSCYCPITNLDHADMAYEWEFGNEPFYHNMKFIPPKAPGEHPTFEPQVGELTGEQKEMSAALRKAFIEYVNGLGLEAPDGAALTLDADGNGSFKAYIGAAIARSARKELDRLAAGAPGDTIAAERYEAARRSAENTKCAPEETGAVTVQDSRVTAVDMDAFIRFRTRMKQTPAFDNTRMGTPENQLFGNAKIRERHFTAFSLAHAPEDMRGEEYLADPQQVRMMNPMNYIGDPQAVKARHYRIRHGAVDRDTSLAISEILCLALQKAGIDAQAEHPWGLNHNGDYDLAELFSWIDGICGNRQEK